MAVALMFWHILDQLESIYNSNALVIAFGNVKPLAQFAYDCLYIHVYVRASHWTDPVFVRESTFSYNIYKFLLCKWCVGGLTNKRILLTFKFPCKIRTQLWQSLCIVYFFHTYFTSIKTTECMITQVPHFLLIHVPTFSYFPLHLTLLFL